MPNRPTETPEDGKRKKHQGLSEIENFIKSLASICAISWAPDASKLLIGDREGNVRIWPTGAKYKATRPLQSFSISAKGTVSRHLRCAAWSPAGDRVLLGMEDGSI
jgi:WD40 repeat protein